MKDICAFLSILTICLTLIAILYIWNEEEKALRHAKHEQDTSPTKGLLNRVVDFFFKHKTKGAVLMAVAAGGFGCVGAIWGGIPLGELRPLLLDFYRFVQRVIRLLF